MQQCNVTMSQCYAEILLCNQCHNVMLKCNAIMLQVSNVIVICEYVVFLMCCFCVYRWVSLHSWPKHKETDGWDFFFFNHCSRMEAFFWQALSFTRYFTHIILSLPLFLLSPLYLLPSLSLSPPPLSFHPRSICLSLPPSLCLKT